MPEYSTSFASKCEQREEEEEEEEEDKEQVRKTGG
jgi:hypothetical protein